MITATMQNHNTTLTFSCWYFLHKSFKYWHKIFIRMFKMPALSV